MSVLKKNIVWNRKQRALEDSKDGKFVIRPFNCRKCCPNGLHFFPVVEGSAANQEMGKVPGLQGANIRPHHVLIEAVKTAKQ